MASTLFLFHRLYNEENSAEEFSTLGDLSEKTLSFPCDGFAGHWSGAKASFVHSLGHNMP